MRSFDGRDCVAPANGHASPNVGAQRARPAQLGSSEVFRDAAMVDGALAACRQQLNAALREIEALRKRDVLLREQVAVLAQTVAKARRFAHRDELTGLPNRRLLMDRFNQAVAQCDRQHKQVALLFLDLDGFKNINDTHGHSAGDSLLQQVAARLAACIRICDTACRYGGDEFVILLPEIDSERNAAAVAHKVRAQLCVPYVVAGTEIKLTTSIGVAIYPVDGKAYGDLMQASDRAMYRNKSRCPVGANAIDHIFAR